MSADSNIQLLDENALKMNRTLNSEKVLSNDHTPIIQTRKPKSTGSLHALEEPLSNLSHFPDGVTAQTELKRDIIHCSLQNSHSYFSSPYTFPQRWLIFCNKRFSVSSIFLMCCLRIQRSESKKLKYTVSFRTYAVFTEPQTCIYSVKISSAVHSAHVPSGNNPDREFKQD